MQFAHNGCHKGSNPLSLINTLSVKQKGNRVNKVSIEKALLPLASRFYRGNLKLC